jgi:hypothetical protein
VEEAMPYNRRGAAEEARPGAVKREPEFLELAVTCPACRSRPAMRITGEAAEYALRLAPEVTICTYKCRRKGCGTIYPITAAAYQGASRPTRKDGPP